ncbi:hypothetical protein [Embleya scabrispora]|uniref:hypothetical protein n=1 Tax=Embleya scabrispora TaxID=159449 RepID=UPI00039C5543|nr:hypothetical protein [Embleya scabrispora]MYS85749.1 hypothetical protein [Streptomyces sp. SID5474]
MRRYRDTDLDELPASARDRRPNGVLEPFKAYLNARFTRAQGQVSGTRVFLEIQARGCRGSRRGVRKHVAPSVQAPQNRPEPTCRRALQDQLVDHAGPGDAHRKPERPMPTHASPAAGKLSLHTALL